MRQVPHYLIIGNGRVARHFSHYLSLLHIPFSRWHRPDPAARLQELSRAATHILLLVSDAAIEPFIQEHLGAAARKVHFSGALVTPLAFGAHPLMTFGPALYTPEQYRAIPFVTDAGAPPFAELLPGLPNPHAALAPEKKAKYHALCVLSGNFSCLLWQKFFAALPRELGLPPEIGQAYLRQQMENLLADPATAFTGPLARGDRATIGRNLAALEGDAFQRIYQCFVEAYPQIKEQAAC